MRLQKLLLWLCCLGGAGCPQAGVPGQPDQPVQPVQPVQKEVLAKGQPSSLTKPPQPVEQPSACTLETALVPGVPGSPGHLIASSINPNGQSELAHLMRTMQADLKGAQTEIARGQPVGPLWPRFRKIRCAWPTNPADRDATFDGLARNYLEAVQKLDGATRDQAEAAYEAVLVGCRSCHEQNCSGALAAIDSLALPKKAPIRPQ